MGKKEIIWTKQASWLLATATQIQRESFQSFWSSSHMLVPVFPGAGAQLRAAFWYMGATGSFATEVYWSTLVNNWRDQLRFPPSHLEHRNNMQKRQNKHSQAQKHTMLHVCLFLFFSVRQMFSTPDAHKRLDVTLGASAKGDFKIRHPVQWFFNSGKHEGLLIWREAA